MRTKHTFRLPPNLAAQLADYAHRKRVPQALVVETALSSHLSPDNSERMEAAGTGQDFPDVDFGGIIGCNGGSG